MDHVDLDTAWHAGEGALDLVATHHLHRALQYGSQCVARVAARLDGGGGVFGPECRAAVAVVVADIYHEDTPRAEHQRRLDTRVVHRAAIHIDGIADAHWRTTPPQLPPAHGPCRHAHPAPH